MGIFDDYKEVKCRDGSTRHILKRLNNIPRVFGEYVPEWEFKINSGAKAAMELAQADVGLEIKKSAKKLYDKILEIDSTARTLFRMAYMQFTTNPCDNDKVLNSAISKIIRLVSRLSTVHKKIEELKEQFQSTAYVSVGYVGITKSAKVKRGPARKPRKSPPASKVAHIEKVLGGIKSDLEAATIRLK